MAWEENSCISLNMQLIAILSRIGVYTFLNFKINGIKKNNNFALMFCFFFAWLSKC